jgi:hypothetical protein
MAHLKKKKDADAVPENKNRSDSKGGKPSAIITPPDKKKKKVLSRIEWVGQHFLHEDKRGFTVRWTTAPHFSPWLWA